jgi:uridine nucleosidase
MLYMLPTSTVYATSMSLEYALTRTGESGLDGVTLLPKPVEPAATDVDHLEAMYRALIATPPNSAWLVSTGTLTNIGLLLQKYTDLAGHLKGLSIMGGAVGGDFTNAPMGTVKGEGERFGNWTPYAEFNVCYKLHTRLRLIRLTNSHRST